MEFIIETADKPKINSQEIEEAVSVFTKWSILYDDTIESLKLFNHAFGTQMTVMLMSMTCRYILFLYIIASLGITGMITPVTLACNIVAAVYMLFELTLLSSSAQRAQNNAAIFRRKLATLLLNSINEEVYYKPVKDLLRLVSTRAVQVQATGSIAMGMTLLPTCVFFFIHYSVIALQFNNIL